MAHDYEATCRAIYDRLFTSSPDSTKVHEVIDLLDRAGITSAVRTDTVTGAIAVEVRGHATYDEAVAFVESEVTRVFHGQVMASNPGTARLITFCNHPDPDVLFHEDGPCPPLSQGGQ